MTTSASASTPSVATASVFSRRNRRISNRVKKASATIVIFVVVFLFFFLWLLGFGFVMLELALTVIELLFVLLF